MPPSRNRDNDTKNKHSADGKQRKYHKKSNPDEPGVQKLKASLRQTRRLLAKENLAADVRIPTERRLKSLEADLAKAELRRKERLMAVRYHKIKFFDKQKVTRKINQTKRALEAPELEKKERKKLQKALLGHRVDLNYIVNYPKLAKYIALYPSSTADDASTAETDQLREERRAAVRQAMKTGEMDMEPEMKKGVEGGLDGDEEEEEQSALEEGSEELASARSTPKSRRSTKTKREDHKAIQSKKSKPTPVPTQQLIKVQEDDFFDT
ncbi:18S rRNA maturation protein [Ceratobasidium sp. 428]|nr:18S rRNA maturation protein [Ceratobasidium sp. 395]KAG8751159.1 18S rRNA maturation protein [Ceratobasidium sp. 428]